MTAIVHDPINIFLVAAMVCVYFMVPRNQRPELWRNLLKVSPLLAAGCAWAYWLGMNR